LVAAGLSMVAGGTRVIAQLPSASTAHAALADNGVARARGQDAIAWNPALLGARDGPRRSLALLPVRAFDSYKQVDLGPVAFYLDTIVPPEFNTGYVARFTGKVTERGSAGFEASLVSAQWGRWGAQLSSGGRSVVAVAPDPDRLASFVLAGNAGQLTFDGAQYQIVVASTAAIAYGRPLSIRTPAGHELLAGATAKYIVGHALVDGADRGSVLAREPLTLDIRFPAIQSDTVFDRVRQRGGGAALDVGLAWQAPKWTIGATLQNAASSFRWNDDRFIYRPGNARFTRDSATVDFEARPFSTASPVLRERLRSLVYRPVGAFGGMVAVGERLTLTGDLRRRLGGGIGAGPRTHVGGGAEFRMWPRVPLRGGLAWEDKELRVAGGAGLAFGSLAVDFALSTAQTATGRERAAALSLVLRR